MCITIERYTYDRADMNQRRMGCIADEVQEVMTSELPEVENVIGSTMHKPGDMEYQEYLTLDYSRLVAPLCAAVCELKKQVEELKNQVATKRKTRA